MIYFPNDKTVLTQFDNALNKKFFIRFSLPLFCSLIMTKTQNSYFAGKVSI